MYVLERTGVSWDVRFYSGGIMSNHLQTFGSIESAKKFDNRSDAEAEKDRLDLEIGIYTMVTGVDDFKL